MKRLLFAGFLLAAINIGASAQGLIHRLAGEPKQIGEVSMPEGAWYFQLISEHEDAMLHVVDVRDGDKYKRSLSAAKEGEARLFFIQTSRDYSDQAEIKQRIFTIGITRGDERYAPIIHDYKGKLMLSSEMDETQAAEGAPFWFIVPVEGKSPYVTIQNRDTKRCLTLGPATDGKYDLILSNMKTANNADQHWKFRLMASDIF